MWRSNAFLGICATHNLPYRLWIHQDSCCDESSVEWQKCSCVPAALIQEYLEHFAVADGVSERKETR